MRRSPLLPAHKVLIVAAVAMVDPRSVLAALEGRAGRPSTRSRIADALVELGEAELAARVRSTGEVRP